MSTNDSILLQQHLDRLRAGEMSARDHLLTHASERLQRLANKMLRDFPTVGRWALPEDVAQSASLRLWRSLQDVSPPTPRDFYRLAALHIRRELLDLARHFNGPHGIGANHDSAPPRAAGESTGADYRAAVDNTHDPARLAMWTEFHRQVEALAAEDREIVDLLWYQGLSQPEAAVLMEMSESTLKRRWLAIRLKLHQALRGELPQ
jgi:RNA polymerase sigma-70 factor (ECF subfamily)